MKILSRVLMLRVFLTIAAVALAIIAIRSLAQVPNARPAPSERKLTLRLSEAELIDDSGDAFKTAIKKLNGDQYSLRLKDKNGHVEEIMPATGASIKIDKVIASDLAGSSDAEFTAIGIHVTQTITSSNKAEIQSVLNTLK